MVLLPAALATGLTLYGLVESRRHRRNLDRIPIRVHVNGTRGKSSVTRLIASGLRAGGIRTFAKTTGTMARMIRPDGSEADVYRVGPPNVIEQKRIVRRALEERAEALVIECMAVHPELQPLCERRLVRSTVGVITNVRADHLDVMGPTVDDAAAAMGQTLPFQGTAFTAERDRFAVLAAIARARGSRLHGVDGGDVSPRELDRFSYYEHADNVALALAVCAHLGVRREAALQGMWAATPDPGVLRRYHVAAGAKQITFVNAFAANDPDSTKVVWTRLGLDRAVPGVRRIVLANCRGDRVQRSGQIAELVARGLPADDVVLTGQGTALVAQRAIALGLDRARVHDLGGMSAERVVLRVFALVERRATVVGIGNIVGLGEDLLLEFQSREVGDD
ncbi:MAG TPA: poly-gamma-glutamate synthase PgsB [Candidatus Omnitrophota bacterium]|jgi:poly-gamma-glutamate synthase PgsB/CapB|nr:poly-gamma-glutamate synthase PgsB [Candidatus Omnitrophota bacterium]